MSYQPAEDGFINLVQHRRDGLLEEELDAKLRECVRAILRTGGNGKIQVTLSLKKSEYDSAITVAEDNIKLTLPKVKQKAELMFISKQHGLVDQHQEQQRLNLEAGTAPEKTLKEGEQRAPTLREGATVTPLAKGAN